MKIVITNEKIKKSIIIIVLSLVSLSLTACTERGKETINNFKKTAEVKENLDNVLIDALEYKYISANIEIVNKDNDGNYIVLDKTTNSTFNVKTKFASRHKVDFEDDYLDYFLSTNIINEIFKDSILEYEVIEDNTGLIYINVDIGEIYTDDDIIYIAEEIKKLKDKINSTCTDINFNRYYDEQTEFNYYSINKNNYEMILVGTNNYIENIDNRDLKLSLNILVDDKIRFADTDRIFNIIKEKVLDEHNTNILISKLFSEYYDKYKKGELKLTDMSNIDESIQKVLNTVYAKHGMQVIKEVKLIDNISDRKMSYRIDYINKSFNIVIETQENYDTYILNIYISD